MFREAFMSKRKGRKLAHPKKTTFLYEHISQKVIKCLTNASLPLSFTPFCSLVNSVKVQ